MLFGNTCGIILDYSKEEWLSIHFESREKFTSLQVTFQNMLNLPCKTAKQCPFTEFPNSSVFCPLSHRMSPLSFCPRSDRGVQLYLNALPPTFCIVQHRSHRHSLHTLTAPHSITLSPCWAKTCAHGQEHRRRGTKVTESRILWCMHAWEIMAHL